MKFDGRDRQPPITPASATEMPFSGSQLDRFCERVLADVSLQDKLRAPTNIDPFTALVVETARDCGFQLDAVSVRTAMRGRLPGMDGLVHSEISETPPPPKGWLPVGTSWQRDGLYLHWSYFGEQRLRE